MYLNSKTLFYFLEIGSTPNVQLHNIVHCSLFIGQTNYVCLFVLNAKNLVVMYIMDGFCSQSRRRRLMFFKI